MAANCSKATRRSSTILAANTSGAGKASAPSRLSSRSQKWSRLSLSRLSKSSKVKRQHGYVSLPGKCKLDNIAYYRY